MKARTIALLALVLPALVLVCPGPTPAPGQEAARGKKYAFLVACKQYDAGEFNKLPGTIVEMKELRQALIESGFEPGNIVFLHDEHPERRFLSEKRKIDKELGLLLPRLRPQDTLVVALNGHGLHFKGEKVGYFLPVDAEFEDRTTMLPMSGKGGLFERLEKCKAGRKLLLVNACRNEPLAGGDFAARKVQVDDEDSEVVPKGIAALYSCRPGQRSFAYPKGEKANRSLFYHHVIEAWRGKYLGGKKAVTLEHVFAEVEERAAKDAADLFRQRQNAQVRRQYDGKWVVNDQVVLVISDIVDAVNGIGYVRLTNFTTTTAAELKKAVARLDGRTKLRGLVLDLRVAEGGALEEAVEVADLFIDDGLIVEVRPRIGRGKRFRGRRAGSLLDFPMVCLIGAETAGLPEVVAAALQDHRRALLLGERSAGQGSWVFSFPGTEPEPMTLWRPSGRNLNKASTRGRDEDPWGVVPDHTRKLTPRERNSMLSHLIAGDLPPTDRQFDAALAYLRGLLRKP